MLTMNIDQLKQKTNSFTSLYHLDGLDAEIEIWYKMWMDKKLTEEELRDLNVSEFIKEAVCFFPKTKKALLILLAQPCTTSTVEHSFSSLRRIKTWLRSTIGEDRLIGLAMMSVHWKFVFRNYEEFLKEVVDKFAALLPIHGNLFFLNFIIFKSFLSINLCLLLSIFVILF